MSLSNVQAYNIQSCVLNDDVDPGQAVSRVGGTTRLTLDATSLLSVKQDLVAGNTGTGILTIHSGQVSASNLKLGSGPGGTGVVNVLAGGRLAVSRTTTLGAVAGSDGSLTIEGAGAQAPTTMDLYVGDAGVGHLTLRKGGQLIAIADATLGNAAGSSAPDSVVQDPSSMLLIRNDLTIGGAGSASLTLSNGGALEVDGPQLLLGAVSGGEGTLTLQGAATQFKFNGSQMRIGGAGKGTLSVQQGSSLYAGLNLFLGFSGTGDGTVRVGQDASLGVRQLFVGFDGKGLIQLTGNGVLVSGDSIVGGGPTSESAAVEMFDASTWSANSLRVGGATAATVAVHGASKLTLSSGEVVIGDVGVGKLTIDGPGASLTLASACARIGGSGTGTLEVINGAAVNPIGFVTLGDLKNSSGTIRVAGKSATGAPSSLSLILLNVGNQGSGVVEVDGGAQLHLQGVNVGGSSGGSGRVTLTNDATLMVDQALTVGSIGAARLEIKSRSQVTAPSLAISGNDAKVIVDSERIVNAMLTPVPSLNVGDLQVANNGLLDVGGGGYVVAKNISIQSPSGAPAAATVHGGSSIQYSGSLTTQDHGSLAILDGGSVIGTSAQQVIFGALGTGSVTGVGSTLDTGLGHFIVLGGSTFFIDQGGTVEGKDLQLSGTLAVTGAGSLIRSRLKSSFDHAQVYNTGVFTLSGATADFQELLRAYGGGTITVSGTAAVLGAHSGDSVTDLDVLTGRVTVNGGLLDAPDIVLHSTTGITSQLIVDGALALMQGATLRVGVNASGVQETGGSATATFRGGATATVTTTTIGGAGMLTVGSGSKLNGAVAITTGGHMAGAGRVVGNVSNTAGIVAPGDSLGTLTVQGAYVQGTQGMLDLQIDGTAPDQYDKLVVTGSADVRGQVLLDFLDGFAPKAGQTFDIINVGSVTAYSPTYVVQGLAPGWQFSVTPHGGIYTLASLTDGVPVPEPGGAAVLAMIAGCALSCGRRRRSTSPG